LLIINTESFVFLAAEKKKANFQEPALAPETFAPEEFAEEERLQKEKDAKRLRK
jgi:hypothetical protein